MSSASVSFLFSNSTTADATQVNQNYSDLVNFLNTHVLHKDANAVLGGFLEAKLPLGLVDFVSSTSDSPTTSGTSEVTCLTSNAVTPPRSGRTWVVVFYARGVDASANGDIYVPRIYQGDTLIADAHVVIDSTLQQDFSPVIAVVRNVPVSAQTFTARFARAGATGGTAAVTATETSPMWLLVLDIGGV